MNSRLLTANGLAEELSLKPETVRAWARQRLIPSIRPSPKVLRFDLQEVMSALREKTRNNSFLKGNSHV